MNWFVCYIVFVTLSSIVGALIYYKSKPSLCDSCKYFAHKNLGNWEFRCMHNGLGCNDHFNKAPTYCRYY